MKMLLTLKTEYYGFNRTFMELKWALRLLYVAAAESFNRTFMELKLE